MSGVRPEVVSALVAGAAQQRPADAFAQVTAESTHSERLDIRALRVAGPDADRGVCARLVGYTSMNERQVRALHG